MNGTIDNGARLVVACPFFNGVAGVRLAGEGGQFGCAAEAPFPPTGIKGSIDGRPVVIDLVRASSATAGMVVATFRFLDA